VDKGIDFYIMFFAVTNYNANLVLGKAPVQAKYGLDYGEVTRSF
jgi:hypothetical protein